MQAVYHCDDRPGISGGQPRGLVLPFIWHYETSKGHVKDKYIHRPEIQCVNMYSPQGSNTNLYKYVYVLRFSHLSHKLCKYMFTHAGSHQQ